MYVFFDLVMSNVGACTPDDIALSVLTTVISHQVDPGQARAWAIVDAGWMAMSRNRDSAKQARDFPSITRFRRMVKSQPGAAFTGGDSGLTVPGAGSS